MQFDFIKKNTGCSTIPDGAMFRVSDKSEAKVYIHLYKPALEKLGVSRDGMIEIGMNFTHIALFKSSGCDAYTVNKGSGKNGFIGVAHKNMKIKDIGNVWILEKHVSYDGDMVIIDLDSAIKDRDNENG